MKIINLLTFRFRFKGKLCEEEIFECDSKPCKNGALCIERNSTLMYETSLNLTLNDDVPYHCKCLPGWSGMWFRLGSFYLKKINHLSLIN